MKEVVPAGSDDVTMVHSMPSSDRSTTKFVSLLEVSVHERSMADGDTAVLARSVGAAGV